MALILIDPFDQYGSITELQRNYTISNAAHVALSNNARTGTTAIQLQSQVGSPNIERALPVAKSNLFWHTQHFAPKLPDNSASINLNGIQATFGWHLTQGGIVRLSFVFDNAGCMQVYSNGYTNFLGKSNQCLFPGAWGAFEFHVVCALNGTIEVRRNEQLILLLTNVDTRGGGNGTYEVIRLGRNYNLDADPGPYYYDDFIAWDDSGADTNNFLGPRRLRMVTPNQSANNTGWNVHAIETPEQAVSLIPPDSVNHYISSDVVAESIDFGFTKAPTNVSDVAGIVALVQGKLDGAAASVRVDFRLDAGQSNGQEIPLNAGVSNGISFAPFKPDGSRWTIKDFNRIVARLTRSV